MKIRIGFVSNSSSSSFTLIVKKEISDAVLKEMPDFFVKWLSKSIETKTFMGNKVSVFESSNAEGDYYPDPTSLKFPKEYIKKWEEENGETMDEYAVIDEADSLIEEYKKNVKKGHKGDFMEIEVSF